MGKAIKSKIARRSQAACLIAAATLAAFWPVLSNGFVNWDDEEHLLLNAAYRGFGWPHLKWMFTTAFMGNYQPLSWLSYAIDYQIWGLDPRGFHLTSLLLHALNAVLFFFVALRLLSLAFGKPEDGRLRLAAAFSALAFSLHPLRVESVAWASERRDVLSAALLLASVLAYLGVVEPARRRRALGWSLAWLSLSLLAKGSGVVLPAVLVVLDFYPLRRRAWGEKALFLAPVLALGLVGLGAQVGNGASMTLRDYGAAMRAAQACYALVFYLAKTALPARLSPLYLHPSLDPRAAVYAASGLLVGAASAAAVALRRRRPAFSAAWACYAAVLAPVLGLIPFGSQVAADRYTYLACLPWALLAGAALARGLAGRRPALALAAAAVVAVSLGLAARAQCAIWRDSVALWSRALELDARNPVAHSDLGTALAKQGRLDEAIVHYRLALAQSPGLARTWNNLGCALASRGRRDDAVASFERALALSPGYAEARANLRRALALPR